MDWKDIGGLVADAAPMLGTVLGGPAGGAIGGLVASVFGTKNDPSEVAEAIKADPEAMVKLRQIERDHERELRRMTIEAETSRIAEVNQTYRTELSSSDRFVRRARPMFLYVVALSIAVEVLIALVVVLWRPEQVGTLGALYSALATPQGIAAAMCGVYLKKRSDDKQVAAGMPPGPGLLQSLLGKG